MFNLARVEVKQDACVSSKICIGIAPEIFEIREDNKAHVKQGKDNVDGELLEKAKEAAEGCPALAIKVE